MTENTRTGEGILRTAHTASPSQSMLIPDDLFLKGI